MADAPEKAPERAAVARAVVEVLWQVRSGHGVSDLEDAAIVLALVGQAEANPLSASDISHYLGIPRPTVFRRLRRMARRGTVASAQRGKRVVFWLARGDSAEALQAASKAAQAIRKAAQHSASRK